MNEFYVICVFFSGLLLGGVLTYCGLRLWINRVSEANGKELREAVNELVEAARRRGWIVEGSEKKGGINKPSERPKPPSPFERGGYNPPPVEHINPPFSPPPPQPRRRYT